MDLRLEHPEFFALNSDGLERSMFSKYYTGRSSAVTKTEQPENVLKFPETEKAQPKESVSGETTFKAFVHN